MDVGFSGFRFKVYGFRIFWDLCMGFKGLGFIS